MVTPLHLYMQWMFILSGFFIVKCFNIQFRLWGPTGRLLPLVGPFSIRWIVVEQILFWVLHWSIQMVWQVDKTNWAWHQTPTSISWWLNTFSLSRLHLLYLTDLPIQWPIHFARYYCGEASQSTTSFIRCNCNSFWRCGINIKNDLLIRTITAPWLWVWLREHRLLNVIYVVRMTVLSMSFSLHGLFLQAQTESH